MENTKPFLIHEEDCPLEGWDDPNRGNAKWKTLISGDRTPSVSLTVGTAEVAAGHGTPYRKHKHAHPEVYYFLAGEGRVWVDGQEYQVKTGSTLFIPGSSEHAVCNPGSVPLKLLYIFAADSFSDVEYKVS